MLPVADISTGITSAIQNLVFECMRSWVNAGELTASTLAQTEPLKYAFEALKSGALFEEAVDLTYVMVHEMQEIDDNMDVTQHIVPWLISLHPLRSATTKTRSPSSCICSPRRARNTGCSSYNTRRCSYCLFKLSPSVQRAPISLTCPFWYCPRSPRGHASTNPWATDVRCVNPRRHHLPH